MNDLVRLQETFEGQPLTTLTIHGRDAWIAREVGQAIGYAQRGKRFATKITGDWSDELIEGQDYQVLKGRELQAFKALFFKGTGSVPLGGNRGLLVLFESGLHLALVKTRKPEGARLRRFLADKVLPQLVRDGRFDPEREVVDGELVERVEPDPREAREQRLQRKLELEDRKFRAASLRRTIDTLRRLGTIGEDVYAAYEVSASEIALGRNLSALKPVTADDWLSPTQIGKRNGVSAYQVGRVITQLGLRGNKPGLAKAIVNKARGHDRTVTSYLYSPAAVRQIEEALGNRG